MSESYVKSSSYLSNLTQTKVTPIKFRLGNDQSLIANSVIKRKITIHSHKFDISALVVGNLVGVDLILGTNTLSDLDSYVHRYRQYTGLASYHGGKHYYYKRLAQGLNVSPGIFQAKIDDILSTIIPNSRTFCIAHHDDIILFSANKASHKRHLVSVLQALASNGLKVSPKKCKLFRDDVTYMGHKITINKVGDPCMHSTDE